MNSGEIFKHSIVRAAQNIKKQREKKSMKPRKVLVALELTTANSIKDIKKDIVHKLSYYHDSYDTYNIEQIQINVVKEKTKKK